MVIFHGLSSEMPKNLTNVVVSARGQSPEEVAIIWALTYVIFLWVANFYPQDVIQQPVNGFVLVEHYEELYNQWQVFGPEHLTWRKIQTS